MVTQLNPEIVMKLKNSNCDESEKLKWWWKSKTVIAMKFKDSNGYQTQNSKCDKTQKLKFWQNWKTQIVTTQIVT